MADLETRALTEERRHAWPDRETETILARLEQARADIDHLTASVRGLTEDVIGAQRERDAALAAIERARAVRFNHLGQVGSNIDAAYDGDPRGAHAAGAKLALTRVREALDARHVSAPGATS